MKYNIHEKKVRVNYFRFPSWDEDYNKYVCTQPCTCIQTHVNFVFLNCITFNMPTLCGCACAFSPIWLFATLWTVARQAPLSMGFSRQNYWSGLPFPSLGDLPGPGIELVFLESPALVGGFFTTWKPFSPPEQCLKCSETKPLCRMLHFHLFLKTKPKTHSIQIISFPVSCLLN